jgi:serine-type D-Ala-D-Ala carboxypeptidase (penicillin-binding protein 5/6)
MVTVDDAPPLSRREARLRTGETAVVGASETEVLTPAGVAARALAEDEVQPDPDRKVALGWIDDSTLTARPITTPMLMSSGLLDRPPHRSPLRPGVLIPAAIAVLAVAAYCITTLLWPLYAIEPTITASDVTPAPAVAAAPAWPSEGSAAVAVEGVGETLASTDSRAAIASITKLVTALAVLDEMPLAVGEQGPDYWFGYSDTLSYWNYRYRGESALDVPSGGSLTEYQMLEGMLIGSANNYADRLASRLWPNDAVYASAANDWLSAHGVSGVTVVEPTGFDSGNTASPAALITLARKALANPVIAEIVAKKSVELPGAGAVENTNGLLADAGVVGVKTGTLDGWNLLSAKDVTIGDTTVRLYASVLNQSSDDKRLAASRALYDQLEAELQPVPSVAGGTVTGTVDTVWGEQVDIVTDGDASVILWNGGAGTVATDYDLGDSRGAGDVVGQLTVAGPLDAVTVPLTLAADVEGPTAWWRLTHPLVLFGLADG